MSILSPENFKDDLYGWLTNQISHTAVTVAFLYLTGWVYFALIFWIAWEFIHYVASRDLADCIEDLYFELSGIVIFLNADKCLIPYLVLFLLLAIKRIIK